jgi:hypothetical protein
VARRIIANRYHAGARIDPEGVAGAAHLAESLVAGSLGKQRQRLGGKDPASDRDSGERAASATWRLVSMICPSFVASSSIEAAKMY